MKEGWKDMIFAEICHSIEDGDWIEKKDQSNSGIRLIQTGNVGVGVYKDKTDKAKYISEETFVRIKCLEVVEGDVLISRLPEPVGRACVVPKLPVKSITAVDCSILKLKDCVTKSWFIYYTQSNDYFSKAKKECSGTTRDRITRKKLSVITIPVPPLSEQQRIVSLLDAEFAKIDTLKANAERNLQNAKDLFQAALKKELEPKEGWKSAKLSDVVKVINGRAYSKEELLPKGKYRVLRVGNFFTNDSWYYSDLELDEDKYCDNGDLLYAWSASFGPKIWDGEKVIYHYHIWKMLPSMELDKYYLYYWLQSYQLTSQVMSKLHGTTMVHITKGIMEATIIQYPSDIDQQRIAQILDALNQKCKTLQANYNKTIALCDDLKQALLRKAFNGEI